ncbi:AsmA-like C-terminal domain-containing protein [Flavobacterium longum]|uniref:AsmA family protein n=1 Tax=Flavobacterium longum TaxID=1299340 RepID=UPI0039ED0485
MKKTIKAKIFKVLKITGITFAVLLLLMFLLPILFPGKIAEEVKAFANRKLNGELNFTEAKLSFFNHFPSLTLTLEDFSLKGSAPYQKETLVSAKEVAFGINLKSLVFDSAVKIDEIYVSDALVNVKVNQKGEANYNVYISDAEETTEDEAGTALKLDRIAIEDCHLVYDDKSVGVFLDAKGFNYLGKGDLDQAIFDLKTEADIESLDFAFEGEPYLKNKKVHAKLITQINTNSLAFVFQKNDLKINKLPVNFIGKFDFLKNGYDMDFAIKSEESKLNDFFTALPPAYVTWLDKTKVKGETSLSLTLKGQYIASENKAPNLAFNMKIRDGEIEYKGAPFPVTDIFLNFDTQVPGLNPDNLKVNLDSLYFNVGKDYLKAIVKSTGLKKPIVEAKIKASMDLKKMDQAFGIGNADLSGILNMDIVSKGVYDKDKNIFPVTKGNVSLKNGYVKTIYYPNPIQNINVAAQLTNGNGAFSDTKFSITPASFVFEGKPFSLNASFMNFEDVAYDIKAKGEIDVAKVYKVFSQKGLDLNGYIKADVAFKGKQSDATNGNYNKLQNSGTLQLRDIGMRSEYFPQQFIIREGLFKFHQDKMDFSNFIANYGQSDFTMNGQMANVINFALSDREVLKGKFSFDSRFINADEFMSGLSEPAAANDSIAKPKTDAPATGVIVVPSNLDLNLTANAGKIAFNGLNLENAKGNLVINGGKLQLNNTGFDLIGCNVNMDAAYGSETPTRAFFDFKVNAKDFDIKRAYNEIPMFREMASAAESAEGIVSLDYQVGGKLDGSMAPIYPSLEGGGVLSVKKVKMKGFKMMNVVSRETGKESVRDPDVSKVDIKTKIKNNIMTIERFKFKVAGFRPRIEGTTSLDGQLNLKMRLGLPPLGIIGIPLTITGTKDDPKVKLGRKTEDLEETIYDPNAPAPQVKTTTPEVAPQELAPATPETAPAGTPSQ